MARFMLLLHETPSNYADFSPEDIQKMIQDYTAWRAGLQDNDKLVGGEKLKDEGGKHIISANGEMRVTDGPFMEAKEVIGGYFAISAADYDEAVEICRDCPHLAYGGKIELREIDEIH